MVKGIITNIQRASLHDGDGVRTTVFFKGCPLKCKWCHNPEAISYNKQELFYAQKCIGCGKCSEGCYSGARVICGKEVTADDVLSEIMQDLPYYGDKGGVTFSGGEPLAQRDFLSQCIKKCREKKINCAVETSLFIYDEEILESLDFVMADLKIWDSAIHKKFTGVPNEKIKENFIRLNRLGIPIIARTPVIPEIEQGIEQISAFLKNLENVIRYELLPYHPLGLTKSDALGLNADSYTVPTPEFMKELSKYAYIR